jgi:threonine dehydrogenase-like Zn-dependent dehydrogenase
VKITSTAICGSDLHLNEVLGPFMTRHRRRAGWVGDILPLVEDSADPLCVLDLTTHAVPLDEAPKAYKTFQDKTDGRIKVVLKP